MIQPLWDDFKNFVYEKYGMEIAGLNSTKIIMNCICEKPGHIVNFMCLLLKQYIYRQRCLNVQVHFTVYKRIVQRIESIEKYIAIKNDKIYVHTLKWEGNRDRDNQVDLMGYINQYVQNM